MGCWGEVALPKCYLDFLTPNALRRSYITHHTHTFPQALPLVMFEEYLLTGVW